jgi:hypothetical protein
VRGCRGGFMESMTLPLEIHSNPPSSLEIYGERDEGLGEY